MGLPRFVDALSWSEICGNDGISVILRQVYKGDNQ